MSNIKLLLPSHEGLSAKEYVEQRLVPLAGDLKRLCDEFFVPGSTAEDVSVDMRPSQLKKFYSPVDTRVSEKPKSTSFWIPDNFPYEQNGKRLKIQFRAVLYIAGNGTAAFRLVDTKRDSEISGSTIQVMSSEPTLYERCLDIGRDGESIHPEVTDYHIEAKLLTTLCQPVCRRFSLSCVYI